MPGKWCGVAPRRGRVTWGERNKGKREKSSCNSKLESINLDNFLIASDAMQNCALLLSLPPSTSVECCYGSDSISYQRGMQRPRCNVPSFFSLFLSLGFSPSHSFSLISSSLPPSLPPQCILIPRVLTSINVRCCQDSQAVRMCIIGKSKV